MYLCVRERTGWINRFSPWLHSRPTNASFSVQPTIQSGCVTAGGERRDSTSYVPHGRSSTSPAPLLACRATPTAPPHSVSPIPIAFLIPKIKFKKIPSSLPPVFPCARRPPKNHERLRGTRRRTRGGRGEQNRTAAEEAPHHVA